MHVVGEIFTHDYALGSLTSPPLNGVQTANVPPGGAAILEFKSTAPGKFAMMDHAMARMAKGLMATFEISGPENASLMHAGPATEAIAKGAPRLSGITAADTAASLGGPGVLASAGNSAAMEMASGKFVAKRTLIGRILGPHFRHVLTDDSPFPRNSPSWYAMQPTNMDGLLPKRKQLLWN